MSSKARKLAMLTGVTALIGICGFQPASSLAASCAGDWVTVSAECPLPADLLPGDELQVTVGSVVHSQLRVVRLSECNGQPAYLTSATQEGCGWRRSITAYRRSGGTPIETDVTGTTALEAQ